MFVGVGLVRALFQDRVQQLVVTAEGLQGFPTGQGSAALRGAHASLRP